MLTFVIKEQQQHRVVYRYIPTVDRSRYTQKTKMRCVESSIFMAAFQYRYVSPSLGVKAAGNASLVSRQNLRILRAKNI
jgi:hypothetical protein